MNGLIPVSVTTLQKRFELTSTQIGILTSIYDGTVILSLLPVSHFGGKGIHIMSLFYIYSLNILKLKFLQAINHDGWRTDCL